MAVVALASSNYAWFAQFFQSELLTSAFTEGDKDLSQQLSRLNTSADKTASLAQRMGGGGGGGGFAAGGGGSGGGHGHGHGHGFAAAADLEVAKRTTTRPAVAGGGGKKSQGQGVNAKKRNGGGGGGGRGGGGGGAARTGSGGAGGGSRLRGAPERELPNAGLAPEAGSFSGKQAFFFRFLFAAESHRFGELLARSLSAKIDELCSPGRTAAGAGAGGAANVPPTSTSTATGTVRIRIRRNQLQALIIMPMGNHITTVTRLNPMVGKGWTSQIYLTDCSWLHTPKQRNDQ